MSSTIHPTAIIDSSVKLGKHVSIGAYACISDNVVLGDHVVVNSHAVISGNTSIGEHTRIYSFASVGDEPQDLKYKGEETALEIGAYNRIREHCTIHRGTVGGGGVTRIGNHCLLMNFIHIAHDCLLGDNVIMSAYSVLAGHVTVGDFAIFGGKSAAHQFVRIGAHSFIGAASIARKDVVPYGMVVGYHGALQGLNLTGLRRRDFSAASIKEMQAAFNDIFVSKKGTFVERTQMAAEKYQDDNVHHIIDFILTDKNNRGFCAPEEE